MLIKHIMKSICRDYDQDRDAKTYQMLTMFTIVKPFIKAGLEDGDSISKLLQISLWILEQ